LINHYLVRSSIVGALGGLLFGFDTAVIAGTIHALTLQYRLSPLLLGLTVSIALWGTVFGAIASGHLGQKLGGLESLRIAALLYVVSALGCAFAWNLPALMVARFLGGVAIGASSVLGPVYIAELAPGPLRGRLVGLFQINIVVGILLAYFSNYVIALLQLGTVEWRWQLGIAALPALFFLIMLFAVPRSARWLVTQNRIDEARSVLHRLGSPDSEAELREMIGSIHLEEANKSEPLLQKKYFRPLFLAITIGAFSQLSGINAVLYYLNDVFAMAGFNAVSSSMQAVAIGLTNLIATFIAMALIDRVGRKALLLTGCTGMVLCLCGVAYVFFTHTHLKWLVVLLICDVGFFAVSVGAVQWVYMSEVFPNRVRMRGQSAASSAVWITNALISGIYPLLASSSGAYPFLFFAGMMALLFFLALFTFPETRGLSLEQLQRRLGIET
jgi:sugar porter (SP) family MFS transporter